MKRMIVSAALVATLFTTSSCGLMPDETATCTVTGKDRTTNNEDGSSDARIYTEDCGTFQVADSLTRGHFRSSDIFGSIDEGKTYEFTYHGVRNGFLSMFPNITKAVEVN